MTDISDLFWMKRALAAQKSSHLAVEAAMTNALDIAGSKINELVGKCEAAYADVATLNQRNESLRAALAAKTAEVAQAKDAHVRDRESVVAHYTAECARIDGLWKKTLAAALAERSGREAQANALTRELLRLDPENPLFEKGNALRADGSCSRRIHDVFQEAHDASLAGSGYPAIDAIASAA